jgi:hypothetical protein
MRSRWYFVRRATESIDMNMTKKGVAITGVLLALGAVAFIGANVYASTQTSCPAGASKELGAVGMTFCVTKLEHMTLDIKAQ